MSVLKFTLKVLTIAGCWQPFSWTSLIKHALYNAYTLLIISLLYSFTFSQFMEIVLHVDNSDDFINIAYTMLVMSISSYKIFNLWMNHESFVTLIQSLTEGTFKPLVPAEVEIQRKFDKMIQINAMCYTILVEISCAGNALVLSLTDFRERRLTFREWVPYDYSSYTIFCLTYAHQYISLIAGALVNVACDNLLIGILLHLCCQITILKYRLKNITNDQNTLRDCVRHHHHIIEYAHVANERFTKIIAFQFVASTFAICSNLYQLTRTTLGTSHVWLITYTVCVLIQIFIYCWFGDKLKLVSLQLVDSIFENKWITLDHRIRKSLLIIMNRTMLPIEFVSAYIVKINLESFVTLLRTSYSAYNLLVQMQV